MSGMYDGVFTNPMNIVTVLFFQAMETTMEWDVLRTEKQDALITDEYWVLLP